MLKHGDLTHAPAARHQALASAGRLLSRQYDAVVANPPYMGSKYYNADAQGVREHDYSDAKADLYACFINRNA